MHLDSPIEWLSQYFELLWMSAYEALCYQTGISLIFMDFCTVPWAVPVISGIKRSKCQKSKHELETFSELQNFWKITRMTRGARPTFWSVFIQLDLRNIFENILFQKKYQNFLKFSMMIFFFDFFGISKFSKSENFQNFKFEKNLCTHPEVRNLDASGIRVVTWNVPNRFSSLRGSRGFSFFWFWIGAALFSSFRQSLSVPSRDFP